MDPLFVDPLAGNYHLQESSPCIGTGRFGDDRGALPFMPTSVDELVAVPNKFELLPSYPNPFNASTTIHYVLPVSSQVIISMYDLLGNNLEIICDDYQAAGYNHITWQADNYPSGIYFFKIQAGVLSSGGRITLLK